MRFAVVALLLLAACVDKGPGPQPRVDQKYARAHLLKDVPTDLDKFDVALGDKAIYLGNKIDRTRLAPGQSLVIKHYWKVVKPVGTGWRPFALVRGPQGTADFMNLEASDMQVAYPPDRWKANDIIEDEQTITIRPDWSSPSAVLYIGLIELGHHTTLDRMAVNGARTQDRAIVAAKLDIDLSRAPPPVGMIHIPRAGGPIAIDGMQIDQGWSNAVTSPEFVTGDGFHEEPNGKATAKMVWDEFYLYLFISVVDTDVSSPYKTHDDPLWKADCVEIFIDADGNRAGYIELQVNPHNATFDSWFAGPRGPAGDVTWDSGMVTAVKVRGTPDGGDTDQGWDVEIGIPWTAIRGRAADMPVQLPPRIGDHWKLNVVRVDKKGESGVIAQSWNRITYADFHALDKMLTAVFADPTGAIVPPPENPNPTPGTGSGSAANVGSGAPTNVGSGAGSGGATQGLGAGSAGSAGSAGGRGGGTGGGSGRGPAAGLGSNAGSGSSTAPTTAPPKPPKPTTGSGSSTAPPKPPQPTTGSGSSTAPPTAPATAPPTAPKPATGSGSGSSR